MNGEATADGFKVKTLIATTTLPGCISTFAYWDPHFLRNARLLNSQTGEYVEVKISEAGGGRRRIKADKLDITLGYEGSEWRSLESLVEGGRVLRYVRTPGPQP